MFKQELLKTLTARGAKPGETVEAGWFMLRVCGTPSALDVETLDLQAMASFTRDLTVVEQVNEQQSNVLRELGVAPEPCTVRHTAAVASSYVPNAPGTFLTRCGPSYRDDSGWILGTVAERLTKASLRGSRPMSLYEISLADRRLLPFWLLPAEYTVVFHADSHELIPPGTDIPFIDDFDDRPWWKFW